METLRGTDPDTRSDQTQGQQSPDGTPSRIIRKTGSGARIHEPFIRLQRRGTTPIEGPKPGDQP